MLIESMIPGTIIHGATSSPNGTAHPYARRLQFQHGRPPTCQYCFPTAAKTCVNSEGMLSGTQDTFCTTAHHNEPAHHRNAPLAHARRLTTYAHTLHLAMQQPTHVCLPNAPSGKPENMCIKGHLKFPCNHNISHSPSFSTTGAWALQSTTTYFVDLSLAASLSTLFGKQVGRLNNSLQPLVLTSFNALPLLCSSYPQPVLELGAGLGCYTHAMQAAGTAVEAYDGVPDVQHLSHGLVKHADLTVPLVHGPTAWVLCLEVRMRCVRWEGCMEGGGGVFPDLEHGILDSR